MRLHKTGHPIADTVSDLIGEIPDGDYSAAYGILRHNVFNQGRPYIEIDKGFWGASHYDGYYRLSLNGTQPIYTDSSPREAQSIDLLPWRKIKGYTLICPPTAPVCEFFGVDYTTWLMNAVRQEDDYLIRNKGETKPIEWDKIGKLVTFNSTLGVESIRRGIPTVSSIHSSVGSYQFSKNLVDDYDRDELFSFLSASQFKLADKRKIECLITHYLSTLVMTPEKQ